MTKRIFRSICLVAVTVFFASVVLIMGVLYDYFSNVQHTQLKMQTELAAHAVASEGEQYFQDFNVSDYRITWIGADGTVLYDSESDSKKMENHLEREEVKEALLHGYGESRRYSATLTQRSFYCAQLLPDGTVLRLSILQNSILALLLGMLQPICVVFAVAFVLSVVLAKRVAKKLVKPLNEIDLDQPLSGGGYDELSPLLRRIDSQQKQLNYQKNKLLQKETELNTIIDSMNEGMVLLNPKGKVLSINPAARKLLDAPSDCVGADIRSLNRNLTLQELLFDALSGETGERVIGLHGEYYQADANPILSETSVDEPGDHGNSSNVKGVALFFFNVTEKEKAEQMRREFTANVSHELKTPLHSISGYAELLKNDMVRPEDRIPFAGKIYGEAQRMICLVEDIIRLSHLDEGAKDMQREDVDLYALTEKAVESLAAEAAAAHVALQLSGTPAVFNGIPQLLYSIVYNLCDNAIKYNRENGSVIVKVQDLGAEISLSVSDTGIGIAPEHHERIFERFYRVDKSHSKEVGGTGLGLSIVKHAAKIHDAKIKVDSVMGKGTTITVSFPK